METDDLRVLEARIRLGDPDVHWLPSIPASGQHSGILHYWSSTMQGTAYSACGYYLSTLALGLSTWRVTRLCVNCAKYVGRVNTIEVECSET